MAVAPAGDVEGVAVDVVAVAVDSHVSDVYLVVAPKENLGIRKSVTRTFRKFPFPHVDKLSTLV